MPRDPENYPFTPQVQNHHIRERRGNWRSRGLFWACEMHRAQVLWITQENEMSDQRWLVLLLFGPSPPSVGGKGEAPVRRSNYHMCPTVYLIGHQPNSVRGPDICLGRPAHGHTGEGLQEWDVTLNEHIKCVADCFSLMGWLQCCICLETKLLFSAQEWATP